MFTITGKILFDPKDKTKKHTKQSYWKRTSMIMFNCDVDNYYAWFIQKRYNLVLNQPLRGAHISFINDRFTGDEDTWNSIKNKWDGKLLTITLDENVKSDGKYWWLDVTEESRSSLHLIRTELGLTERPYFGLHLSIGYANEKNIAHSNYIHRGIKNGLIN